MAWTAAHMPDLVGRTAIVTGANGGLGLEIARALSARSAHVVLACRNVARGEAAAAEIRRGQPTASLEVRRLDTADLASVRELAAGWSGSLDLLVNNAGVMAVPKDRSADGFELHLATNHLGHFALTGLLLEHLLERPDARVVTMSSNFANLGRVDPGRLEAGGRYNRWTAYGRSKLANQLFAFELARRVPELTSVAAHPGYAATDLQLAAPRASGNRVEELMHVLGQRVGAQTPEEGARPALYAATAPDVSSGEYFAPRGAMHMRGDVTRIRPPRAARDLERARQLWDESERLTGVTYPAPRAAVA